MVPVTVKGSRYEGMAQAGWFGDPAGQDVFVANGQPVGTKTKRTTAAGPAVVRFRSFAEQRSQPAAGVQLS